tara:strand:- start:460 stop:1209 length:750 start_codon:yes stop_codon:yes gene_type:complete
MKMFISFMFILMSSNHSIAFSKKHQERLKDKKDITYEDLAHENPGCPENSECSAPNGLKIAKWLKTLKAYSQDPNVLSIKLERYRKKNGLPINFLAFDSKELKQSLDPVIWDSRCRHHNIKDKTKIIKAMQFFRNNPKSKQVVLTKVKTAGKVYEIPYGDQPLMIWKKGIILIKDYEEFLYHLSVNESGKWKVVYVPSRIIKKGRISKSNIECSEKSKGDENFLGSYCSRIWNEDKKDYVEIEQQWACP